MRDNKRVFRHIAVFLVGAAIVGYGMWLIWPPLVFLVGGGTLMMLAASAYDKCKPTSTLSSDEEMERKLDAMPSFDLGEPRQPVSRGP